MGGQKRDDAGAVSEPVESGRDIPDREITSKGPKPGCIQSNFQQFGSTRV